MTDPILKSAADLSGTDVKNAQGENLGHVKDIMFDVQNHRAVYYVLSFGGFLGMGDKQFAVPPEAMKLNAADDCFVLNIDQERLKNEPGFDKDHRPNMADAQFRSDLYQRYGMNEPTDKQR